MNYRLEILRNKAYRPVYTGKMSKCFTRLSSIYSRCRIRNLTSNEVIFTRKAA